MHFQQFLLHASLTQKTLYNLFQIKFKLKKPLEKFSQMKFLLKNTSNMSLHTSKLQRLLLLLTNLCTNVYEQIHFFTLSFMSRGFPMWLIPSSHMALMMIMMTTSMSTIMIHVIILLDTTKLEILELITSNRGCEVLTIKILLAIGFYIY